MNCFVYDFSNGYDLTDVIDILRINEYLIKKTYHKMSLSFLKSVFVAIFLVQKI